MNRSPLTRKQTVVYCSIFVLVVALTGTGKAMAFANQELKQHNQEASEILKKNVSTEGKITAGEFRSYRFRLTKDWSTELILSEFTYPLEITVTNALSEPIAQIKTADGEHGPRTVKVIAPQSSDYFIRVQLVNKKLAASFKILLSKPHPTTSSDRDIAAASRLSWQAKQLQESGDAESMNKALQAYNEAIALLAKTQDPITEAAINWELGAFYVRMGAFAEAEQFLKKTLEIREKELGPDALDTVAALSDLGLVVRLNGDVVKSEEYLTRALKIREKKLPATHADIAETLNNLAGLYRVTRRWQESEKNYLRSLSIRETTFGPDHQSVAESLNNLALLYDNQGLLAKAEPFYRRALNIYEKALGPKHIDLATVVNNLGMWYQQQGQHEQAKQFLSRALEIRKEALGTENSYVAESYNNLACVYLDQGLFNDAEKYYLDAIGIFERGGSKDPRLGDTFINLGCLYSEMRRFDDATTAHNRAIELLKSIYGEESADFVYSLHGLAGVYIDQGLFHKARELLERALPLAKEYPDLRARVLHDIAVTYFYKGDYDKAEELQLQAVDLLEKELQGRPHTQLASTLHDLAVVYEHKGRYADSDRLHRRALDMLEEIVGPEHPMIALELYDFAVLYDERGDYERAADHYFRALAMREKVLHAEHPQLATSLTAVGRLYAERGDYAKAEELLRRALQIREKALGENDAYVAQSHLTLAGLYRAKQDYKRAEEAGQKALEIYQTAVGPTHEAIGDTLYELALIAYETKQYTRAEEFFLKAQRMYEDALGRNHPDVATVLTELSAIYEYRGDYAKAVDALERSLQITEDSLRLNLVAGSEQQKNLYLRKFLYQSDRAISLSIRLGEGNPKALALGVNTVLRRKGRSLDVAVNNIGLLRQRAKPEDRVLLDQLANAQNVYSTSRNKGPGKMEPGEYNRQLISQLEQVRRLESQVADRSEQFRLLAPTVSIEIVQQALPTGTALIEFVLYRPYDPQKGTFGEPHYAAFVLSPNTLSGWVDLGEAKPIDDLTVLLRKSLQDPKSKTVNSIARELDSKTMAHIRPLLRDQTELLLSADGQLNLVPFAVLVNEKKEFLLETYSFTHLTSGRDLLREKLDDTALSNPVIVANPTFDLEPKSESPRPNGEVAPNSTGFAALDYKSLPGTATEAAAIKSLLASSKLLEGPTATESELKRVVQPRILHVATHGFFLPDIARETDGNALEKNSQFRTAVSSRDNPLLRSGLILAGVKQQRSGPGEDGVLTAMELAGMNLWGTSLVVLSACETGIGDVPRNEGLYGLRRALVLAGSESQVISLWKVSDSGTRDLMSAYYTRLLKGEGRGEALRQVQLAMFRGQLKARTGARGNRSTSDVQETAPIKNYRHPYYWAAFIQSGNRDRMELK